MDCYFRNVSGMFYINCFSLVFKKLSDFLYNVRFNKEQKSEGNQFLQSMYIKKNRQMFFFNQKRIPKVSFNGRHMAWRARHLQSHGTTIQRYNLQLLSCVDVFLSVHFFGSAKIAPEKLLKEREMFYVSFCHGGSFFSGVIFWTLISLH